MPLIPNPTARVWLPLLGGYIVFFCWYTAFGGR